MRKFILLAFVCVVLCHDGATGEFRFSPSDDTMVYSGTYNSSGHQGNYNYGMHQGLYVGNNGTNLSRYRSLLRFDLAAAGIASASITGAELRFTVSDVSKVAAAGSGVPIGVYCVHTNNAAWEEGARQGSLAPEGWTCWAALARNRTPWYGEPGIGTNGVGVVCRAGGATVPATAAAGDAVTIGIGSADALAVVRGWAEGAPNAGFLLAADDEPTRVKNAVAFASRENTSYGIPRLVVCTTEGDVELAPVADAFILAGNASGVDNTPYADYCYGERNVMVTGTLQLNNTNQLARSLVRFDTSAAAGTCVTSAVLRLTSNGNMTTSSADPLTLHLKLMGEANAAWRESADPNPTANSGHQAIDGACTWNWLARNRTPWTGGLPVDGEIVLSSVTLPSLAGVKANDVVEFPITSLAGLRAIQQWCDDGVNAGFALVSDETVPSDAKRHAFDAGSKENGNEGKWPCLVLHAVPGSAAYVDRAPSADGYYYNASSTMTRNWGADKEICIGLNNTTPNTYRAIMRFDVANAYASTHVARAASLTLTISRIDKVGAGTFDVRLHMLADGNAGWGEGAKSNTPCAQGDSCWNFKNYSATEWIGGAGLGIDATNAGIDMTLATVTVDAATAAVGQKLVFEITDADALARIDRWVKVPDTPNAGFWLTTDEASGKQNAVRIAARDNDTSDWRPKLSILAVPSSITGTFIILK